MAGPPLTTITFTCAIAPEAGGSTVSQHVSFSGPLAFLLGPLPGGTMARHFGPVLDDLATAAEQRRPPSTRMITLPAPAIEQEGPGPATRWAGRSRR